MKLAKLYLSFICFFTGHIVAETLLGLDYEWCYAVYNWLMNTSVKLDVNDRIWGKA